MGDPLGRARNPDRVEPPVDPQPVAERLAQLARRLGALVLQLQVLRLVARSQRAKPRLTADEHVVGLDRRAFDQQSDHFADIGVFERDQLKTLTRADTHRRGEIAGGRDCGAFRTQRAAAGGLLFADLSDLNLQHVWTGWFDRHPCRTGRIEPQHQIAPRHFELGRTDQPFAVKARRDFGRAQGVADDDAGLGRVGIERIDPRRLWREAQDISGLPLVRRHGLDLFQHRRDRGALGEQRRAGQQQSSRRGAGHRCGYQPVANLEQTERLPTRKPAGTSART